MQARRTSSCSPSPPSSPPSVLQYDGEGVLSPEQTLWTAHPSPTQTLCYSSPELPPLASLSALRNNPRTPSTVARHARTDSTYYTASWGSPYQHPPPVFNLGRNPSTHFGSDDLEEDSSNLQFGLEHLLPPRLEEDQSPNRFNLEHLIPSRLEENHSPVQFNLEHLIPSRLLSHQETPTRLNFASEAITQSPEPGPANPTEEWVRQFLDVRWNSETSDWWSEDKENSGLVDASGKDRENSIASFFKEKGHKTRNNNKTLNQQDFWSHFSEDQKEELGKMMASRYANPDAPHSRQGSGTSLRSHLGRSTHAEKPPASPRESNAPESPRPLEETSSKLQVPAQPVPAPRPRKKVMVKGKGCIISIARDIPRGTPGYPPKPMSPAALESKMQQFKQDGYDIRGFGYWNDVNGPVGMALPQNRGVWPDESDIRAERANTTFRVRIPRKADWDAYVEHLVEAKLAALGVSLGGEEDIPLPLSRPGSQHPGNPFSPPLPTSSAGSHRMNRQGSIVSGSFPLGPSPGHMSRQSIASPIPGFGNPRPSMHMHRHSTFNAPANFSHHSASPSGAWSPGNYFGPQGPRGGSPALPLSRPDLSGVVSPGSPFGMRANQQFPLTPTQKDDLLAQMQHQQQLLHQQLPQQLQQQQVQPQLIGLRPSSTLAEVPEDEAEEDEVPAMKHASPSRPDIVVPTPRNHRHNLSANLEREAQDAQYHLEEAIDKQFDEGGDFSTEPENNEELKPSKPVTDNAWEGSRPVLHQPQPHNRAHSLAKPQQSLSFGFGPQQLENPRGDSDGARTNLSDVTNPSLGEEQQHDTANSSAQHSKAASQVSNSWKDSKFAFPKAGSAMHSKHTSRSSTTKLNVEAKEFKFNPSASFSPGPGSFSSGFSFSPAIKSPGQESAPRSGQPSVDGLSGFNVTAPVFKPDAPVFKPDAPVFKPDVPVFKPDVPAFIPVAEASAFKPVVDAPVFKPAVYAPAFTPAATNGAAMPTSGFDFFSKSLSFKPDAPAFNPGSAPFTPSTSLSAPTKLSSKIFGEVNISASDIIKPAKRSKAVPIVRPDATRQQTPEEETQEDHEDESGRITQAEGREKRVRRGPADGDDIPKFATQPFYHAQPLGESKQPQAAKQDPQLERETMPEDKENLSPNAERAPSKSKSPDPLSLQAGASFEPDLPTPRAEQSAEEKSDSGTPIDDRTPHESDAATPTVEDAPNPFTKKHSHKSSLSAAAKPFEFRPQFGPSGYDFGVHVTKPSVAQSEDLDDVHGSSPRHASRSPANTYRPSDDGSYKTALGHNHHYPESESVDFDHLGQASFNDIDAVMKHMNMEGSDFGVERDEHSWEQSSPRLSTHEFERNDLPPNTNMRSDAPSPSPRRLYAPKNIQLSSVSIVQNPFDDERAGLAYESPVHRLNNADEVPMSDWDEGLLSEGEDKIQTRSRFFDSHVDDLIGRLLQNRLDPLERNLQGIQDSMAMMFQRSGRGRRSMSTSGRLDSDADDEDDDIGTDTRYRNRSPRKDRKLEKMRSIVREALESYQPPVTSLPVPVPEPVLPEKIREIIVDTLATHQPQVASAGPMSPDNIRDAIMEALAHHQPQWTPPKFEPVPAEQIRAIVEEAIVSHKQPAPAPSAEPIKSDEIRSIVAEVLASHAPVPSSEPIQPDAMRSIVMEAFATHAPPSAPAVEPVQPDTIRSIVAEALASHRPAPALEAPIDMPQPQVDMSEIYQVIGSLKASIAQTTGQQLKAEDVRELMDDALKRQNMEIATREEAQALEEKDLRIAELESMLKEATLQINNEAELRSVLEAREVDGTRLLKVTEEELTLLREAATDDENKIRALEDNVEDARRSLDTVHTDNDALRSQLAALQAENDEVKLKAVAFESSEEDIKSLLQVVAAENATLKSTLEEHRLSAEKWRNDIQQANEESDRMRKAIEQSKLQAEEATRVREAMRAKFDKLQQDMIVASGQIAAERSQWQKSDEDHMKKYEVLSARIEAEGRTRERLERELERLETQEREGMKLRVILEQSQKHNTRLEETIEQLKQQSLEHQRAAERYEREFREAREAGHVEIRRTRVLMEADIDAANNQVNIVRADLESEISRVRAELDNVRMDTDTLKEKHELDLEAAADAKKNAVAEALGNKQLALQEQQHAFERRLELLAQEHGRALDILREDKARAEAFHHDRLSLADSKVELVQDKVSLLEEKLAIAKEAASAAAAAAQSIKSPVPAPTESYTSGGSGKISPQALRESISVLQEQLQERESRIESLEHQLSEADSDAPAKLKERDTEIGWLRELLGVRVDDLNDLINALAQPSFDRENVRDAAIRIRTNLQMEQQEKERLMSGGQSFPTLATLSNFASPKAVQLAAAFGNWRSKGRESASSALAGGSSNNNSRNQTPSRGAASAQSFLSGLMTPPTSNLRRTPDLPSSGTRPQNLRSNSASSRGSNAGFPSLGKQAPSTPLLRPASYDQDAEVEQFSESGFYDDDSTIDGEMTPIALSFGQELRR
ncbi:hypothetical protein K505DRAFT_321953 [Melanomma pulvis-pyrius CBS 109.77]|uniref:Myosin class II heavy chain n=1 Tax=Melanomma pulvis-pyrius CBS 109.77 TaxID=1314802 RepID=A0A6A6XQV9_9PLEO|nr:hypothetical protein K505DRAFT_321953 [Melanomma pulvis-pyrius CBS 109.77]